MSTAPSLSGTGPVRSETVTFLFTDIEGSTRLLQKFGDRYPGLLTEHLRILRDAVEQHGGRVFGSAGDAIFAAFPAATAAVEAAISAQRGLAAHPWPEDGELRVRIGVHTGEALVSGDDYAGLDVHRVARIMSVAWGGQIVVSAATSGLVDGQIPGVELRDLGEHRLKDLARPERLYQVVAPGLRADFPALRTVDATPNNLPTQLTSFIGRDRELQEASRLLEDARLLTLTGPGGTGKTRLSLQLAAECTDRFPDGVFFVPLASVADPDLVPSSILTAIGLADSGGRAPLDLLTEHLRAKRALLVLDNFEQILAAAPVVAKLLGDTSQVTIIVTSRAPLRVHGEQEYPVPPLAAPAGRSASLEELTASEAVTLFVTRAAAVKPGFTLTEDNAAAIAEIAARLDGLPLAIELAAARVRLLTPAAIASRLGRKLDLLSGGGRDVPTRQRTLRDAIAWSYDLLDQRTRRLFGRLSVFMGGAALEHIEAICGVDLGGDVLDNLTELVEHSLVRQIDDGDEPRFEMLEVIREFAAECLPESDELEPIRRRHAETFLDLAERAEPHLLGVEQATWLDALQREHDNLRAAISWAVEKQEVEIALRLLGALWRYWQIRGHLHEGRHLADQVLAVPGGEMYPRELAAAYEAAGGIAYWQADPAMERYYARSLELFRQVDDPSCIARALYNLAFAYATQDEAGRARAEQLMSEALTIYEQLGDRLGAAKMHWGLADIRYWAGDFARCRQHLQMCLPVFREVNSTFDVAWSLYMLGLSDHVLGSADAARSELEESLRLFVDADDRSGVALLLWGFSFVAEGDGDFERSLRLRGASLRLADQVGTGLTAQNDQFAARYRVRRSEEELPPDEIARLVEEGRRLTVDDAIALALSGGGPRPVPTSPSG